MILKKLSIMRNELKYAKMLLKIKKVFESCETSDQIETACSYARRFHDCYKQLYTDDVDIFSLPVLYENLTEILCFSDRERVKACERIQH